VVCVLKGLLEDGEMLLPDGRRFINRQSPIYTQACEAEATRGGTNAIGAIGAARRRVGGGGYDGLQPQSLHCVQEGFQLIALANRPGFPFLGNDFFSEMGDAFATMVVDNPDRDSELSLLAAYGPTVPNEQLTQICGAFSDLRGMSDRGEIAYPFSTREAVAVTRHLAAYPEEGVAKALMNVLAFDHFNAELLDTLQGVMAGNGIEVALGPSQAAPEAASAREEPAVPPRPAALPSAPADFDRNDSGQD